MKRLIAILAIVGMLTGCASLGLNEGATSAEKKAAYCADAKVAIATAEAALATVVIGSQEQAYWLAFKAGAQVAITTYCQ